MSVPHAAGELIESRYRVLNYVDKGGMQYVFRARDELLGRDVALKTPQNNAAEKRFKRSAVLAAQVHHANVAKTLDYFEFGGRQYLVEEYVDGANLSVAPCVRPGFLDPYLAAHVFHHLARGIEASHRVGIIHRDLKPSNVMVSSDLGASLVKVTDFGVARMAADLIDEAVERGEETLTGTHTAIGALPYMSPEAIQTPKSVGLSSDIWSVGALMYELVCGHKPFGQGLSAVTAIVSGAFLPFPAFVFANRQLEPLSRELTDLIKRCLSIDPSLRPTAAQLVGACSSLCYPIEARHEGVLRPQPHGAWGFISMNATDTFYHRDSFYGPSRPQANNRVVFSRFVGTGAWRAHPVVGIPS